MKQNLSDPVVDEIREVRHRISARFDHVVCSIAAVVMTGGVVWINMVAYRKIDELEEL